MKKQYQGDRGDEVMKFYHGTSTDKWAAIQKEGVLFGIGMSRRFTYLTPQIDYAMGFGSVILEVEYVPGEMKDNYCYENPHKPPHPDADVLYNPDFVWQFCVFEPIPIERVRVMTDEEKEAEFDRFKAKYPNIIKWTFQDRRQVTGY